jgi:hypothetical protein
MYEDDLNIQKSVAEIVLGKRECLGKLPVHFA